MDSKRRINTIKQHLIPSITKRNINQNNTSARGESDNDVVICYAKRTAIGKAKRGSFKDCSQDQMLTPVLKDALKTVNLNPKDIGDVVVGNVLPQSSQGAAEARVSCLMAGIPMEVAVNTVNRQCSSGLQALANVTASIKAGFYDLGIAAGVESMSQNKMGVWNGKMNPEIFENELAKGCLLSMGVTSDNVAKRFGVSREKQDHASVLSHQRAAKATQTGRFRDEIVPIKVTVEDKSGNSKEVVVSKDEGIRVNTTLQRLSKLRAVFSEGGTTTAGNASQLSDGAAVVVAASRGYAKRNNLPIIGSVVSFAAVGVEPDIMGVGPAYAIPAALKKAGLTVNDIDLYEVNEAFASQYVWCVEELGISFDKVNVNGGAIALGHPLGCTGARMTSTLLHEMRKRKAKYGVVSMCCGTGMGAAMVFKAEY